MSSFIAPISLRIQAKNCNTQNYCCNHKWRNAKVIFGAWNRQKFMVEKEFQTIVFILMKGGYNFRWFNCNRELIQDCWLSYRENMFANIELISLRNKKILGNGWSKAPRDICSEKCSRLSNLSRKSTKRYIRKHLFRCVIMWLLTSIYWKMTLSDFATVLL